MEPMSLVEAVLNQGNEEENERASAPNCEAHSHHSSPIKGLNESVTITVTRTPGRPANVQSHNVKPANFAMLSSPVRNGRKSDDIQDMVCKGCERVFKYKAAFLRHESQCGLPVALKIERAAINEAKRAEKMAEIERRKVEVKQEKLPELRCPTCSKLFTDNDSFKLHNFNLCAEERATYSFECSVCKAKFKYKNHLRRHEDSHNNVRRYNCDICTTAFLRPDHLKRHMTRMHGIVQLPSQNAPKNIPMQCPVCTKILSRRDHLLRHMRNVHHVNIDSRNGKSSDSLQGIGGSVDQDRKKDSCPDDEDGSENMSMTSHDGLMIDESFESVKSECESPPPEDCDRSFWGTNVHTTISRKRSSNESQRNELSKQPENCSYNPCEGHIYRKKGVSMKSVELHMGQSSFGTFENIQSHPSYNNTRGDIKLLPSFHSGSVHSKSESVNHEKSSSSDGNQNVLSNGHGHPQNTGNDWISDLANYSGW